MKTCIAAAVALGAVVTWPTLVSAQEWDSWDGRERPSAARDYYDGYGDRGNGARVYRRYDNDDDRRYDPRYNNDSSDADPAANDSSDSAPADSDRRYSRGNDERYDDDRRRDDYGAWDAAPPPGEEEELSKEAGVKSGDRPFIKPVAPPVVAFSAAYSPGSIVIDTGKRKLYYILNSRSAYAYPIAVGRQGFGWAGKEKISRIADWPDWYPPADMRKRKPSLPKRMLGGIRNPLGAKAIYLGNTLYRIHGTNEPKSIGKAESSGCFRMLNQNVLHLASLVHVGTEVNIVRSLDGKVASAAPAAKPLKPTHLSPARRYRWGDDDNDTNEYDPRR